MIDYTEIAHNSDGWEQFARDFLSARGFYIESTIDRGPDHGKDMLIIEHLKGELGNYQFRWLVSCKHFAKSGHSVSEDHEPNILERLAHFGADGFIGFYSTLASSGLNSRLKALRDNKKIRDYSIMDGQLIENLLITAGYSPLMMRYFPKSYQVVKPLHLVLDEYRPLACRVCGKDLLLELFVKPQCGIIVHSYVRNASGVQNFEEVYVVCKGDCDKTERQRQQAQRRLTGWADLDDMVMPIENLRYVFATMNLLRAGHITYTDEAFEQEKQILIAVAQRVLRSTTEEERERFQQLAAFTI
jgi:hypothetical protein